MNAKQRRRERLKAAAIEREADMRLARKIAVIAAGCSSWKIVRALNGPAVREATPNEYISRENPAWRKASTPHAPVTRARQKRTGKSIPLI